MTVCHSHQTFTSEKAPGLIELCMNSLPLPQSPEWHRHKGDNRGCVTEGDKIIWTVQFAFVLSGTNRTGRPADAGIQMKNREHVVIHLQVLYGILKALGHFFFLSEKEKSNFNNQESFFTVLEVLANLQLWLRLLSKPKSDIKFGLRKKK